MLTQMVRTWATDSPAEEPWSVVERFLAKALIVAIYWPCDSNIYWVQEPNTQLSASPWERKLCLNAWNKAQMKWLVTLVRENTLGEFTRVS